MSRLLGFLEAELAPAPGRTRATGRLVVACLATVLFTMTVRMPYAYWVLLMMFGVALPDAGASLRQGIDRMIGTIVGGAAGLGAVIAGADQPWLLPPLAGALAALGVHGQRNTRLPYASGLAGLTAVIVVTGPATPDAAVAAALWRTAAATLGVGLGTAAQLWLWPDDPADLLLDDVARRLELAVTRLDAGPRGEIGDELPTGLARQLDLLANAETRHPGLRRRHVEQLALIGAAERVLTGALVLPPPAEVPPPLRSRVARVREGCRAAAAALRARQPLAPLRVEAAREGAAGGTVAPAVVELELAVAGLAGATAFLARDREPPVAPRPGDAIAAPALLMPGFFAPRSADATAAVATGLACALSLVLVQALVWPGIHTAALTCVVVAQSTLGASVRKAGLRIGGALLGGLLALITIVGAMPFMVSIASLLVVMAPAIAIAAWINVGSARINYAGYQTMLAYGLALAAGFGPSADLVTLRDRVVGICVGIVVSAAVHLALGARRAGTRLPGELRATLQALARLTRVGVAPQVDRHVSVVRGARLGVYQSLATVMRLADESVLEPGAGTPPAEARREVALQLAGAAQAALLALLNLVRHRLDISLDDLPEMTATRLRPLADAVVASLDGAAESVGSGQPVALSHLDGLLDALASAIAAVRASGDLDAERLAYLQSRHALYAAVVPHLHELARLAGHPALCTDRADGAVATLATAPDAGQ